MAQDAIFQSKLPVEDIAMNWLFTAFSFLKTQEH